LLYENARECGHFHFEDGKLTINGQYFRPFLIVIQHVHAPEGFPEKLN
jgi:hypothetical protein